MPKNIKRKKRGLYLTKVMPLDERIVALRGQRVILDAELAEVYGVSTKALNQAIKRNRDKFPGDFMFRLTKAEANEAFQTEANRSQIVTGSQKHRDPRFLPYAFTEHGAVMAANVLNSPRAVQMSVFVVRAFIKMRAALGDTREMARTLGALEHELKARLDVHEAAFVDILQRIMKLLDPPPVPQEPPKEMGFHVKEDAVPYRIKRRTHR